MSLKALRTAAVAIGRRLPQDLRTWILTVGGRYIYFHPLAQLSQLLQKDAWGWEPLRAGCSVLTPVFRKTPNSGRYLDLSIALSLNWDLTRRYEHGTLGIEYGDNESLGNVIIQTFRQTFVDRFETIRVRMPREVESASHVRLRILPAPHCDLGAYKIAGARFIDDPVQSHPLSRIAELESLKERARISAAQAEANGAITCEHFPVALTLELTAACNLTCSHCVAHGEPALHRINNSLSELSLENLEALAHEVFPSLDVISVVGRGEPFVLKEQVWKRFVELVILYRVRLAITTNGYFLDRRLTRELLPFIDSINFSMDGATRETFAVNRGGADLDRVMASVILYHQMRKSANLARAPRLYFAWTLKRNNVAELPSFVRKIADIDADALTTRHLQIYYQREAEQSLLTMEPREANRHMAEAYALLEQFKIRRDCVPLFVEPPATGSTSEEIDSVDVSILPDEEALDTAARFGNDQMGDDREVSRRSHSPDVEIAAPGPLLEAEDNSAPPEEGDEAKAAPDLLPPEPCMFIHRMPVVMAGGEVMACAVPGAVHLGTLGKLSTFNEVWNGELLGNIRGRLNTADEWPQCQTCHYREARVASQRALAASGERYDNTQQAAISRRALDFVRPESTA